MTTKVALYGAVGDELTHYQVDVEQATLRKQKTISDAIHVRTFSIDPSGRLLVAASIKPHAVRAGANVVMLPAAMTVFRIAVDGKLEFVRKYDVGPANKIHYWTGMVGLG
jgi:hypothetical protein